MGSGKSKCDCSKDCDKPVGHEIVHTVDNREVNTKDEFIKDLNGHIVELIPGKIYLITNRSINRNILKSYTATYKETSEGKLIFDDVTTTYYVDGQKRKKSDGTIDSGKTNSLVINKSDVSQYYEIYDFNFQQNKGGKKSKKHLKRKRKSKKKSIDS